MSDALSGEIAAEEALENSQWVTNRVIERTRLIENQNDQQSNPENRGSY
jgi:hypothetical protein